MGYLFLGICIFSLCMIIIYAFFPSLIYKINHFFTIYVFSDVKIMFNRKKILVFYFLIFTFSFVVFLIFTEVGSKYTMSAKTLSAYRYFYSGKLDKALAICNDVLSKDPRNYKVMELIGKIYLAMGEKEMAISYLHQAETYAPENVRIRMSSFLEKLK